MGQACLSGPAPAPGSRRCGVSDKDYARTTLSSSGTATLGDTRPGLGMTVNHHLWRRRSGGSTRTTRRSSTTTPSGHQDRRRSSSRRKWPDRWCWNGGVGATATGLSRNTEVTGDTARTRLKGLATARAADGTASLRRQLPLGGWGLQRQLKPVEICLARLFAGVTRYPAGYAPLNVQKTAGKMSVSKQETPPCTTRGRDWHGLVDRLTQTMAPSSSVATSAADSPWGTGVATGRLAASWRPVVGNSVTVNIKSTTETPARTSASAERQKRAADRHRGLGVCAWQGNAPRQANCSFSAGPMVAARAARER